MGSGRGTIGGEVVVKRERGRGRGQLSGRG